MRFRLLRRIWHTLWRWRPATLPIAVALGLAFLATYWRQYASTSWPLALIIPVMGISFSVTGPHLSRFWSRIVMALVPNAVDSGRPGVLDRTPERVYLALLTTTIGLWLALRVSQGATALTQDLWLVATLGFGGSWWGHRRIRGAHRGHRYHRRWRTLSNPKQGPIKELYGSRVVSLTSSRTQTVLTVRLAAGMTASKVALRREELASFFSLRPAAIHLAPDERNARRMQVRIIPRDPWRGAVPHPMPAPGTVSLRESDNQFVMGIYADGDDAPYTFQHTLICGMTGSGKSMWLESLLVWLSACDDCIIVAGDLAAGATLRVWEPMFARPLADDYDSVVELLLAVIAVIEDREQRLGYAKAASDTAPDSIPPSPATPWLVLIIDEYPDFVAEARSRGSEGAQELALVGRIAKRIRKTGGRLILLAQNGSKDDLGSKELQGQLKSTVGLALDPHASRTLWGQLRRSGFDSVGLQTGQYLLHDEWNSGPHLAKGFYVSVRARRDHINLCAKRPILESSAWHALTGKDITPTSIQTSDSIFESVTANTQPTDQVWQALAHSPTRATDLAQKLDMSRATVFRRLQALARSGHAHSQEGIWHADTPTDT